MRGKKESAEQQPKHFCSSLIISLRGPHIPQPPGVFIGCVTFSSLAFLCRQSLRTWLVFNAAGRAWTLLRFSDVIVDLVFIWCIAFSILGYLFHVDLKKECCVLVILKCCLQHCGHSVYRWCMKPQYFFLLPWAPNMWLWKCEVKVQTWNYIRRRRVLWHFSVRNDCVHDNLIA